MTLLHSERFQSVQLMKLKEKLTYPLAKTIAKMPNLKKHLSSLTGKQKILDIGCGYGSTVPYVKNDENYVVGLDVSLNRLSYAKRYAPCDEVILADCRMLPFRDKSFSASIMIMLIHHLPSYNSAFKALKEAMRVSQEIVIFDYSIQSGFLGIMEKLWLRVLDSATCFMSISEWTYIINKLCKKLLDFQTSIPVKYFCLIRIK